MLVSKRSILLYIKIEQAKERFHLWDGGGKNVEKAVVFYTTRSLFFMTVQKSLFVHGISSQEVIFSILACFVHSAGECISEEMRQLEVHFD